MNHKIRQRFGMFLILGIAFVSTVILLHSVFTSRFLGANDFFPRWKGAQLFITEGIDPYSDTATEAIQYGIQGRPSRPDEDQFLFVYPFYTIFLLIPFVWLPYDWVQAIWMAALIFGLAGGLFLTLQLIEWRMKPWLLAITFLWGILFYHSARTVLLGQFAGLVFLWIAGCLLALRQGRDFGAGVLLALTTVKPQMSFLLIPALLLWGVGQRRWRFVGSFTAVLGGLVLLSFLFLPSWLTSFITQITAYPGYTAIGSPLWVITSYYFPWLGKPVEIVLSLVLLGWLLVEWRQLPRQSATSEAFLFTIGLTLVVTNLVVLRTATTNYVEMYVPLFWLLQRWARRFGEGVIVVFYVVSGVLVWWLFLVTVQGDFEQPIVSLPLPFFLLGWMVWRKLAVSRMRLLQSGT
ncbi:MAG: DUF2029 domain-containing protein [Chloroflexi bacterium]|nr:MAG: DUF2029 domain-containing protein [Chloroflexota bacterium]